VITVDAEEGLSGARASSSAKPGGSAGLFYEQQRKAWISRNRRVFRVLDAIVVVVVVGSLVLWSVWPATAWYGGLVAGAALCFDLSVRLNPPTWIEQWQSGAFGEERTGRELARLDAEWTVVHDVQRQSGANIDHVVVGPPGIFLLDSKNIGTEVRIDGDELLALRPDGRQRYRDRSAAGKARGAAAALSQALTAVRSGCWVHAVVVVWGDMAEPHVAARNLDWVAGPELVDWLSTRTPDRDQDRVARARDAVLRQQLSL
jgi:hypothetical protein